MYPPYDSKSRQCYESEDDLSDEDIVSDKYEPTPTGGKVRVKRFRDGSSSVHWGGPCGVAYYDEFGREC